MSIVTPSGAIGSARDSLGAGAPTSCGEGVGGGSPHMDASTTEGSGILAFGSGSGSGGGGGSILPEGPPNGPPSVHSGYRRRNTHDDMSPVSDSTNTASSNSLENSIKRSLFASGLAQAASIQVPSVLGAKGLLRKDFFRLPDPFCKVSVDGGPDITGQSFSTGMCRATLDPRWSQNFDMYITNQTSITISVWNQRKMSSKKESAAFLGCVRLKPNMIQQLRDAGGKRLSWQYFATV
ncbi:E3 ubiquitin-protein ligase SMURF2-like [Tropilaelaps mercedesae]|uniref:E3 ubiquitin-protein ligase SMURF2-like n=1 Tax=Tropilaelaps mercedesae TaxID=418985 RepID=A0A1V9XG72_9ACAR|nr:E3 ubiquitin-protein ligase SMURF2-like [Tropilaelaps mercedesae]